MKLGDKIISWVLNLVKVPKIIKYYLILRNITGKNNIDNDTIVLGIGK